MTEHTPTPDDEIVSAHLDGEATTDEAARVAAEADLRSRLRELEQAHRLVAEPVTPPNSDDRERAVAAALGVFDREVGGGDVAAPTYRTSEVAELAAQRAQRARRQGRLLSAAAAVLVLIIGAGAIVRMSRTSRDTAATVASGSLEARQSQQSKVPPGAASAGGEANTTGDQRSAGPTTASPLGAPALGAQETTTTSTVTQPDRPSIPAASATFSGRDLGSISTPRQLRDETELAYADSLSSRVPTTAAPSTTSPSPSGLSSQPLVTQLANCDGAVRAHDNELGALLFSATATYQGHAAVVFRYELVSLNRNGPARIYAVDRTTCNTLAVETPSF